MSRNARPARERFEARVDRTGECWQWTGSVNPNGYGSFSVNDRTTLAHRFSYRTYVGEIPAGAVLDHLCRNRSCVNPDHLDVVTQRENYMRGMAPSAISMRQGACRRGHRFTEANTYYRPDRPNQRICRECHRVRAYAHVQKKREAATRVSS